ncbi:MAG: biotin--[acetyl-CoA-carboxylase] ligase [Pseudomonadota bacterium]
MRPAAAGLPTGYRLLHFSTLDSTMAEAERQALAEAPSGTLILADRQTAGRGRRGREWQTPAGNLALSALLRPSLPLSQAALLGFAAGLALHEAVSGVFPQPDRLTLKWPNDLLLDGAKLAGILLESHATPKGALQWLVIGLGVNLTWAPTDTPYAATALSAVTVAPLAPSQVATAWASAFDAWSRRFEEEGFGPLRRAWKTRAAGLGAPLQARLADGQVLDGVFQDLDSDGSLLLKQDSLESPLKISAGDVFFPAAGKLGEGGHHAAGH